MKYQYPANIKAYEKSVIVDGISIFPLTEPKSVAEKLRYIIKEVENQAYTAGWKDAQEQMRKAIGIF